MEKRSAIALFVACVFLILPGLLGAAESHYPGKVWQRVKAPADVGWSPEKLTEARSYAATLPTSACMIVVGGKVLDEWNETATRFKVHSVRKSFLSALYGIHVQEGGIDLSATLQQLKIDDNEPFLSPVEKTATIRDLLKARSGIYHTAVSETARMKATRPPRGSYLPGTYWHYNNWDFNALGTIFEQVTGTKIFEEFKKQIANPVGMQDYRVEDGEYVSGKASIHRAYHFRITARDMARFGLLYLRQGVWKGRQLIPREWIKESTTAYSDAGSRGGYGYMWWVSANGKHLPSVELPDGAFSARGNGGQYILIVPPLDLVIVHQMNTEIQRKRVTAGQFGKLVKLILEARISR